MCRIDVMLVVSLEIVPSLGLHNFVSFFFSNSNFFCVTFVLASCNWALELFFYMLSPLVLVFSYPSCAILCCVYWFGDLMHGISLLLALVLQVFMSMAFASRDSFPCGHYCCFLLSPSPSILLFFPSPIFSSMLFSASYYGSRVRKWLGYWFSNSCNVMRKWNLILGSWMEFLFSFLYLKF